jgi:hypothetical protein
MKDGLEIEKRYLLSRLPDFDNWDDIMNINQYYGPNGRFRKIIYDVNSIIELLKLTYLQEFVMKLKVK